MAIEVGDAVFRFLGDMSSYDASLATVGPKAKAAFEPATEALDEVNEGFNKAGASAQEAGGEMADAGKLSGRALREARGEAALLGEEFGIRLPRHVRSFIAELPGVGTALQLAFNATAVLFIIQALITAEEKLRAFLSSKHKAEQEAMTEGLKTEAAEVKKLGEEYDKAAESLDRLTMTPLQILNQKLVDNGLAIEALNTNMHLTTKEQQAQYALLVVSGDLLKKQIELEEKKNKETASAKTLASINKEIELRKKLADVQATYLEAVNGLSKENADQIRYQAALKALQAQAKAEAQYGKDSADNVRSINAEIEKLQTEHGLKLTEELNKETLAYDKNLAELGKSLVVHTEELTIAQTVQQTRMEQLRKAADALGITLKSDLVFAYMKAVTAQKELLASGIANQAEIAKANEAVTSAKNELDSYGQSVDKFKLKSSGMWKEFQREAKGGATAMDLVKQSGVLAFDDLNKNVQGAFSQIVMGEGNVAKALERATASSLSSIAAQAAIKALFYTGEGLAALAGFNAGSAANYFAAAGEMAAIAGVAGLAGRALSGASGGGASGTGGTSYGSGKNNYQYGSSVSDTGSQAGSGRSNIGVQAFADGGLVTKPTLALIGEAGPEMVVPLGKGAGVGSGSGGAEVHHHTNFNIQVKGLISGDNLAKVCGEISKKVARGQATLNSSSTFKVTRRGA